MKLLSSSMTSINTTNFSGRFCWQTYFPSTPRMFKQWKAQIICNTVSEIIQFVTETVYVTTFMYFNTTCEQSVGYSMNSTPVNNRRLTVQFIRTPLVLTLSILIQWQYGWNLHSLIVLLIHSGFTLD
jgi:hypothetical protein